MNASDPIQNVYFTNRQSSGLEIEVLSLQALFQRNLPHSLEKPQRVHFYLIILFTGGAGVHYVDFVPYNYNDHTVLFIAHGQVQHFQINPHSTGYLILFTPQFLYRHTTELNLLHSLQVFDYTLFTPSISPSTEQYHTLLTLCTQIQAEASQPEDIYREQILRHLLQMLLLQSERIRQTSPLSRTVAPFYYDFVTFRKLVKGNLSQTRKVSDYAAQMFLSTKQLNTLTRQVVNKSAKKFIDSQVILEAQRRLSQGTTPIKEIAYQLGFSDLTSFGKFFKKYTDTTPATFRRQYWSPPQ